MTTTQTPPPPAAPAPARKPAPLVTPRRIVISVVLAVAVGLFGFGFASGRDTKTPAVTDPSVERTEPAQGDLSLRQSRIGIDLAPGFTAELKVDGVVIPDDQIERVVGLDEYYFTPGPGTETGQLTPGRHCAVATITKLGLEGALPQVHDFAWCFSLH